MVLYRSSFSASSYLAEVEGSVHLTHNLFHCFPGHSRQITSHIFDFYLLYFFSILLFYFLLIWNA